MKSRQQVWADRAKLEVLVAYARKLYEAMSSDEKEAMYAEQRASWARAEMAFGSDADEERYKQKMRDRGEL